MKEDPTDILNEKPQDSPLCSYALGCLAKWLPLLKPSCLPLALYTATLLPSTIVRRSTIVRLSSHELSPP